VAFFWLLFGKEKSAQEEAYESVVLIPSPEYGLESTNS